METKNYTEEKHQIEKHYEEILYHYAKVLIERGHQNEPYFKADITHQYIDTRLSHLPIKSRKELKKWVIDNRHDFAEKALKLHEEINIEREIHDLIDIILPDDVPVGQFESKILDELEIDIKSINKGKIEFPMKSEYLKQKRDLLIFRIKALVSDSKKIDIPKDIVIKAKIALIYMNDKSDIRSYVGEKGESNPRNWDINTLYRYLSSNERIEKLSEKDVSYIIKTDCRNIFINTPIEVILEKIDRVPESLLHLFINRCPLTSKIVNLILTKKKSKIQYSEMVISLLIKKGFDYECQKYLSRSQAEHSEFLPNDQNDDIEYITKIDFLNQKNPIQRYLIEEAKNVRMQILESQGLLQMSKSEFQEYFLTSPADGAELKQGNVGNCYAVAAIHALSSSPHLEIICRSSMKKLDNGNWEVRIPLMSEFSEIYTITPEDLKPQRNREFLNLKNGKWKNPDLRLTLNPPAGKEGFQALEAAYLKHKLGSVDRLKSEGGWSDEVLSILGGENFNEFVVNSYEYNYALKKFEYGFLNNLDSTNQSKLDNYLENFNPELHIATLSTSHTTNFFYRAKGTMHVLVKNHAYSISKVDKEAKLAYIHNPWNTKKTMVFTFDQLKENFENFRAIRIDSSRILSNMYALKTIQ